MQQANPLYAACWHIHSYRHTFYERKKMNGAMTAPHTHTHTQNLSVTVNTDLPQSLMISIVH